MVATLAAPLMQRGAQIGMVMGTAYLFTQQAVVAGANAPGFQRAALARDRTVLLKTAPGHTTRCADSPYVHTFTDTQSRLGGRRGAALPDVGRAGATRPRSTADSQQRAAARRRRAGRGGRAGPAPRRHGHARRGSQLRSPTTPVESLHAPVTGGCSQLPRRQGRRPGPRLH